jgi:hypothetical protein
MGRKPACKSVSQYVVRRSLSMSQFHRYVGSTVAVSVAVSATGRATVSDEMAANDRTRARKKRRLAKEDAIAMNVRTCVEELTHNEFLAARLHEGDLRAERRHARELHAACGTAPPENIAVRTAQPHTHTVSKAGASSSTHVAKAAGSVASTSTSATAAGSAASSSTFAGYPWTITGGTDSDIPPIISDDEEPAPSLMTPQAVLRLRELFE